MTKEQLKNLKAGDIVRGKLSGDTFIVVRCDGERATGVRVIEISQPDEWDLVAKFEPRGLWGRSKNL